MKIIREYGFMIEYDYDDNHQVTEEKMLNPQANAVYQHNYEYDEIGNRKSKWYDNDADNKKVTYGYDTGAGTTHQKLQNLSGTRGLKMTVAGTVSDVMDGGGKAGEIEKIEVTPSHYDGETKVSRTPAVEALMRLPFFAVRGVELYDDDDNEIAAKAFDKAGNVTTDTKEGIIANKC